MSFLGEIKRRKVFQVAAVYLVVAWLIMQVVDVVAEPLLLPEWFARVVILLLAIGFPIALVLSWAFDLTSGGIERTASAAPERDASKTLASTTGQAINLAVIGALAVVLIGVSLFVLLRGEPSATAISVDTQSQPPPVTVESPNVLPNSIAVLPFENLSPDPDNAYFAAGIHEAILNELAKIRAMNVIARTSMLAYADGTRTIPEIARELNVETVMEGSVQYAGNRVRITTQLIDPTTNAHIWSEDYDRDLEDIFAIQSDVAMNVANALEAEFSLQEQARIEEAPTHSTEAYGLYLRALASSGPQQEWRELFDQAIELDPNFALAYAEKAYRYAASLVLDIRLSDVIRESAERALELDDELGRAYAALALLHQAHARWDQAREMSELAVQFSPNDPAVFESFGILARYLGDYQRSIELGQRAVELDPNRSLSNYQLGITYRYAKEYDAAYEAFSTSARLSPATFNRHMQLGFTEIMRGNDDTAFEHLQIAEELSQSFSIVNYRFAQFALGYSYLDRPDHAQRLFDRISDSDPLSPVSASVWAMAYIAIQDYDEALTWLELAVENQADNTPALGELRANSYQDSVLDEPRFRALRDRIGT